MSVSLRKRNHISGLRGSAYPSSIQAELDDVCRLHMFTSNLWLTKKQVETFVPPISFLRQGESGFEVGRHEDGLRFTLYNVEQTNGEDVVTDHVLTLRQLSQM